MIVARSMLSVPSKLTPLISRAVTSLVALAAFAVLSSLLSCSNLACFADTGLVALLVVRLSTMSERLIKFSSTHACDA